MTRPKASYLYVIEDAQGRCKIGHGKSPKARRRDLSTGNADTLTLAFKVKVDGRTGDQAESVAHDILAAHRVRGEWFAVSKSVAAAAARMAATGIHHPELIERMRAFDAACGHAEPIDSWDTLRARSDCTNRAAQAVEDVAPGLLVAINSWNEIHLDAYRAHRPATPAARVPALESGARP